MALLELKGLTKSFGGLTAVSSLDLNVERGEIVGLIGPNGAGKTTVFNAISGVSGPTSGKVFFKGDDITGLKPHSVAKKGLMRTFQITTIFSELTVLQNIRLGSHLKAGIGFWAAVFNTAGIRRREKDLMNRASELAEFMGLGGRQNELAKNLSHGHQRALEMAIALVAEPELLLLDEPVAGMSVEETADMMKKIRSARERGVTILLVEHDMKLVMDVCTRICVLNFGSKLAEGNPREICENREVVAAYLGSGYQYTC
jgi:branched-chain amino acid transport system ATP-binding protein